MVGIIVVGHGRFAQGLTSAINLIAGEQKEYIAVNFEHEIAELTADLTSAIEALQNSDGILIFTDLQGGSPFKIAAELSVNYKNIEIVSGTNLPMLAETVLMRSLGMDLKTLTEKTIETGKENVTHLDFSVLVNEQSDEDFTDGI